MIETSIIWGSPLATEAERWEALLAGLADTEERLGWRYIWEGGSYARRVEAARKAVSASYYEALDWAPADAIETGNRAALMADLCAYERAFANVAAAIAAWPDQPISARDPRLADLIK